MAILRIFFRVNLGFTKKIKVSHENDMNYKLLLGLLSSFFILDCKGMEQPQGEGSSQQSVSAERPSAEDLALAAELAKIPADELAILKGLNDKKKTIVTAVVRKLFTEYSDHEIPVKRQRRLDKALKLYHAQNSILVYKAMASALGAASSGYYTYKGCKTPETIAAVGAISASLAFFALKYGNEWWNLSKPTHASIAQQLKEKMSGSTYDARPPVLRRINKIFNPSDSKEK